MVWAVHPVFLHTYVYVTPIKNLEKNRSSTKVNIFQKKRFLKPVKQGALYMSTQRTVLCSTIYLATAQQFIIKIKKTKSRRTDQGNGVYSVVV